ncbi:MAG: hypothetical protein NTV51_12245, partial [Verrucomicrobia bacterium]|nr:hypothetical protein [Verrucomicrobiota bacterium]
MTIAVEGDARPEFARVIDNLRRPDLRKVMGRALATKLRTHFTELDRTRPNQIGGKRTHFWGDVRRSVQQPQLIGGDGILVAINHVGAAQRYFGGDIEPVNGDWLTIPARAEAYGKRAREFDDLHFVFFRRGLAALVQNESTTIELNQNRKKDRGIGPIAPETTGGGIFYWLVTHV